MLSRRAEKSLHGMPGNSEIYLGQFLSHIEKKELPSANHGAHSSREG